MINRRAFLAAAMTPVLLPRIARGEATVEIGWEDLIPPGVPYAEVVGEGYLNEQTDIWIPEFDQNATKLNRALDGNEVRLPGYVVPLEFDQNGISEFILAPYAGACIHVPPPPANQLVLITPREPWPIDYAIDAVWVRGIMRTSIADAGIATVGYRMDDAELTLYQW